MPSTLFNSHLIHSFQFESFTFGKVNTQRNSHGHSRSHSRNTSISSTSSLPFSVSSKSTNSFDASASFSNPAPSSKHNSHHRRRSSVSTRRESAEIMGVSLPDLPPSTSDDNINFGDKDSIRRRALWALEGKCDVPYSKVEIPELSTPVMEKLMADLRKFHSQLMSYPLTSLFQHPSRPPAPQLMVKALVPSWQTSETRSSFSHLPPRLRINSILW